MSKREITGKRPLNYSRFHREQLPPWCYMTDLDSIEWRDSRGIVALIETADIHSRCDRRWQMNVIRELSCRADIPAYFVRYDQECRIFLVERIDRLGFQKVMDRNQYIKFIREL